MELIGRQFGHIRVTEVVGQGGMGDVYGGYDEKLERKVALKVLNADQRLDEEARERLLREARALSRLDHNNICRIHDYIETGDVDLLVLEYIDGRTLHEALGDGLPRSEKLRIAIAIAEVLVTAHRAGIVHRDLKPENVMLTKHGEVKVLDFGLARWFNRSRSRISSDRLRAVQLPVHADADGTAVMPLPFASTSGTQFDDTGRRQFLATAVGITLGTPLFMSPEQARGESLTPASDMFAFGLLLQVLFSGKDPHPPGLTAHEVILRVARGATLPVEGAARDITSLINRLKQFAPTDRPTAVETLERLHFLAEKPQRLARRTAIAVVVLLALTGTWRYTVDLKEARLEAEHRRAQAENLIEFMLGDLTKKLKPVGRLDVLDDVGERAMEYVQSLDPDAMSVDELVHNAKALNQLGEVRMGQGKTPEAMDLFRRSLVLADDAVKRDHKNARALLVHGATHFWLGNGLRLQGDTTEALRHMRAYMEDGDALVRLDPASKENQLERAYGHSGVALILDANGDYAQALQHYRTSLAIKQELARRDPDNLDVQADVARADNKVGGVLYNMGDLRGALEQSRKEVEIYRRLLARDPKQAQWKQRLATSMAYLGRALNDTGNTAEVGPLLQEELGIERELVELDPTNIESRRAVAMTLRWLARSTPDDAAALRMLREARTIMADVLARAPSRTSFVVEAADIDGEYGRRLSEAGDVRGVQMLRDAIARLEPMHDSRFARYMLARNSYYLGEALAERDPAGASAAWARAESEFQPLLAQNANPAELALWFRVQIRRSHLGEARATLARIRTTGYAAAELERLCSENGC